MSDVTESAVPAPTNSELLQTVNAVRKELEAMTDEQILMVYVMMISDVGKDEKISDIIGDLPEFESEHDMLVHLENVQEAIDMTKGEPPQQSLLAQVL